MMPPPLARMRAALNHATGTLCELAGPSTAATLLRHEAEVIEILAREAGTWSDDGQDELQQSLRRQLAETLARDAKARESR